MVLRHQVEKIIPIKQTELEMKKARLLKEKSENELLNPINSSYPNKI